MSEDTTQAATTETTPAADEMVPKSVMLGRIAQERKKLDATSAELASMRAKLEELTPLQERLKQIEEEKELAGKSATEKAEARYQRDLEKLRRENDEARKALAERDAIVADSQKTIRTERTSRAVMDAMSAAKVIRPEKAVKAAMLDITFEYSDDGSIVASYGDTTDVSVAQAVAAWAKDNDHFLPAPAGGAGTRANSGGHSSKPLHDLSDEELLRLGKRQ